MRSDQPKVWNIRKCIQLCRRPQLEKQVLGLDFHLTGGYRSWSGTAHCGTSLAHMEWCLSSAVQSTVSLQKLRVSSQAAGARDTCDGRIGWDAHCYHQEGTQRGSYIALSSLRNPQTTSVGTLTATIQRSMEKCHNSICQAVPVFECWKVPRI